MGSFLFRWPYPADHVYVTGTFDDWGKSERLNKVEGAFEKEVELPSADDKVLYKFVVDDDWIVDDRAPKEDDGHYNVNNVLYPHQIKPITPAAAAGTTSAGAKEEGRPRGHRVLSTSSAPPGSNAANALTEAPTVSAGGEGAPLLTKEQSEGNLARWIPHVIPSADRPVTRSLPSTEAPSVSAGGIGAPLLTKEQSQANLAREIPHITPSPDRPVTRSLPQTDGSTTSKPESATPKTAEEDQELPGAFPETLPEHPDTSHGKSVSTAEEDQDVPGAFPETPAGEPAIFGVAPLPATGHDNTQSSVTTSKEDYENAGGEGTAGGVFSAPSLPATGHKDMDSSVTTSKGDFENAGGEGTAGGVVSALPMPAEGHKDIESSATTSKEDYDKIGGVDTDNQEVSVAPIPATGHKDLQSSVTTSKEDYEKAGALGTAGVVAGAGAGAALFSVFSKPKASDKNIIPESSLPMNPEQLDTVDRGPFLNSAGPGTTTADLASQVPLEPKREAQVIDSPEAPEAVKQASSTPFISSAGPGTTTGDLASQVPLEPKREAEVVDSSIPHVSKDSTSSPFISSVGAGATTAGLASGVPLEPKRDAQVVGASLEAPAPLKESDATPFISSSGPGTTTADLASQVPLEQKRQGQVFDADDLAGAVPGTTRDGLEAAAPAGVVAEKAALEKELLQKVPESEAKGAPASAAKAQTSYYGLATSVPEAVEKSIAKAHTSPEAATEPSAVAEKSAVERELQAKVPVVDSAGEPAPTISASTATTTPDVTSPSAASTAAAITDGKTANQTVPDTDTSTATRGLAAGEIAGGAVAGGAAAAGTAALVARHEDRDVEPARIGDSQKPNITTEATPSTQIPGASPFAAAQVSDGSGLATPGTEEAPRIVPPVEKSDADATDYAPPHAAGIRPGVSASAAAALSDGTEDPTLMEESTSRGITTSDPSVKGEDVDPVDQAIAAPSSTVHDRVTGAASNSGTSGLSGIGGIGGIGGIASGTSKTEADVVDQAIAKPAGTVHDKITGSPTEKASAKTGFTQSTLRDQPAKSSLSQGTLRTDGGRGSTAEGGVTRSKSFISKLGGGGAPVTPKKGTSSGGVTAGTPGSTTSTPQSTPGSTKKRHRLSQMFKKIFD